MEYHPATISIIISPGIIKHDIDVEAEIAINSPIIFIDGGAPKLKAESTNSQIINGGKIINKPLFRNKFRVVV